VLTAARQLQFEDRRKAAEVITEHVQEEELQKGGFELFLCAQPVQSGDLSRGTSFKIGICGKGGCELDNSSNLLLPMRAASFANKALMHELRNALVRGVNVVVIHGRDLAAVVEDFDEFISACPADIKSGLVLWEGRKVQCPRLFDALAVDWFDAPG
jgi:hypothetical protein